MFLAFDFRTKGVLSLPIIDLARSEMEQKGEVDLKEKRLKVLAGLKIQEKK